MLKYALGGFAAGSALSLLFARSRPKLRMLSKQTQYVLHLYDHCPFCFRVELLLSQNNIPYKRVVYGYGQGASPDKCGYDETGGPVALTGKKMLPVLEVDGTMMGESLEIIG